MNARTPNLMMPSETTPEEAPKSLGEIIDLAQNHADQGEIGSAIALYARWLEHPQAVGRPVALYNLASLLQLKAMYKEAEQCYLNCINLAPSMGQAYVNMGLMLERMGNVSQALEVWSRYVARRHHDPQIDSEMLCTALNHIGRVQENLKNYDLAESALRESLLVKPDQPGVIQHWVHIRQKSCIWPVYQPLPGISVSDMVLYTSPLAMLALSDDPVQQQLCAQSFVQRTYPQTEDQIWKRTPRKPGRLRLGLVSGDFKEHAVGFLLPAFLDGINKNQYEIFGYDYAPEEKSALRSEIISKLHHCKRIAGMDDKSAAELIANDSIDILIDLHGLSSGARPGIFALHPAPRQGTYLGYMGTTSMPWFDFVLVDREVMTPDLALHFRETPVFMDGCFIPLTGQKAISEELISSDLNRSLLGLAKEAFVMAAFGNVYKITEDLFNTWLDLLERIPQSILWLLDDNDVTTRNLKQHAMNRGIDLTRLIFARRCNHEEFCNRLKLADVYLDTYPYNCGSTTNDVVNAGIPFVTRYGRTLVSRMGKSILSHINHPNLATTTFEEYKDKVVEIWLDKWSHRHYPFALTGKSDFSSAIQQIQTLKSIKGNSFESPEGRKKDDRLRVMIQTHVPLFDQHQSVHTCAGIDISYFQWVKSILLSPSSQSLSLYGFLPSNFGKQTGLALTQIEAFSRHQDAETDLILFNPFWDLHGISPSPFKVTDRLYPGFSDTLQSFCREMGINEDLDSWIAPSEGFCISTNLLARRRFWIYWLELTQLWMDWGRDHHFFQNMTKNATSNSDSCDFSDWVHSLIMNLVIMQKQPCIAAMDPLQLPSWQSPPLISKTEYETVNGLKHAWRVTRTAGYKEAILRLTSSNE